MGSSESRQSSGVWIFISVQCQPRPRVSGAAKRETSGLVGAESVSSPCTGKFIPGVHRPSPVLTPDENPPGCLDEIDRTCARKGPQH